MELPSKYGSGYLYFFSSFSNISSIAKHGQFSRDEVALNPSLTWNDIAPRTEIIESRKGISGFLSLYFGTHTATQFWHEKNGTKIAFIRYDADEVFRLSGAWFTDVAYQISRTRWRCDKLSENLKKLDWGLINSDRGFISNKGPYSNWKRAQAELLLEESLPSSYIHDIVFLSENHKQEFLSTYGQPFDELSVEIDCVVDPELFIKAECRKCSSVDAVRIKNYSRQWCEECEHNIDYSGRYGRYMK